MKNRKWAALALVGIAAMQPLACSDFSSCMDSRSCPSTSAEAGEGGDGGTGENSAGASGSSGANETIAGGENSAGSGGDSGGMSPVSEGGGGAGTSGNPGMAGTAGMPACGGADLKSDPANCGTCGNACGSSTSCVSGACVDSLPPTIISIIPADGATKLTPATDTIVITFSEPMNKAATQAAFVPSSGEPVFSWNAAGSELTIDPKVPYPAATDPAAAATPYKYNLSTAAKDLAGNSIAAAVSRQLSLLREVTQTCPYSYGGNLASNQSTPSAFSGTFVGAGDTTGNVGFRGFMSFDISGLPNGIQTFESATLSAAIVQLDGNPFGLLGNYLIQSVAIAGLNNAAYSAPVRTDLGTFIAANGFNALGDPVSKDVLVALKADYADRVTLQNASQYRVLFPTPVFSDGVAEQAWIITTGGAVTLSVKYLFP